MHCCKLFYVHVLKIIFWLLCYKQTSKSEKYKTFWEIRTAEFFQSGNNEFKAVRQALIIPALAAYAAYSHTAAICLKWIFWHNYAEEIIQNCAVDISYTAALPAAQVIMPDRFAIEAIGSIRLRQTQNNTVVRKLIKISVDCAEADVGQYYSHGFINIISGRVVVPAAQFIQNNVALVRMSHYFAPPYW